jgi:hypothetical protein
MGDRFPAETEISLRYHVLAGSGAGHALVTDYGISTNNSLRLRTFNFVFPDKKMKT